MTFSKPTIRCSDDIALGTVSDKQFNFYGDSQWDALGGDGKFAAPEKLKDAVILQIELTR